ncbi:MAG: fumarylacetoacetate hydrolase family protein, partial [Bacteroidota bacterium]
AVSRFVPLAELKKPDNLEFRLDRNGQPVQHGHTADMIFSVHRLIAYVSQFMTLRNGDLIFTGTPAGVGPVALNDHLQGYLEGQKLLDFRVK